MYIYIGVHIYIYAHTLSDKLLDISAIHTDESSHPSRSCVKLKIKSKAGIIMQVKHGSNF